MGYSTKFSGVLKFKKEPSVHQLAELNKFFGEDTEDHPEWEHDGEHAYIDLELTDDFTGIQWNGAEKTRGMLDSINTIVKTMRKTDPYFSFVEDSGFLCQGEKLEDRYRIYIGSSGYAQRKDIPVKGYKAECPSCGHEWFVEQK